MQNIHVLIKPSSGMCNLRCKYCFYHDEAKNRAIGSYGFMTEETLENVIKKTIESAKNTCTIAYQGGEPTLRGLDFFKKSIEYQNKYNTKNITIHNAIQTNGIDLDDEFVKFFKENNFLVGISLDGNEYTHNMFRMDASKKGTFNKVLETIDKFNRYGVEYNILTVVNSLTAKKIKSIYKFYKENKFEYLQFIPCLNPIGQEGEKFEYSLTPDAYSLFLKTLFDLWYWDIKKGNYIHIQRFENYIMMLLRYPPEVCGMSGVCTYQNVIEADGEVYPCDFYVLDEYKLGNLNEVSFEEIDKKRKEIGFIEESVKQHQDCLRCKYRPICRGGCKRYREPSINGEYSKNYYCKAYYEFFEYAIERLQELATYYYRKR